MKTVKTQDAVGKIIGHDITEIVPGVFKGVKFKKGHLIKKEDIEVLLRLGKENIFVFEMEKDCIHEDDAALKLGSKICGVGTGFDKEPREGKITIYAQQKGLLKIDRNLLQSLNQLGDIAVATIHEDRVVEKSEKIAGCRIIPLTIKKERLSQTIQLLTHPILEIKPLGKKATAIIATGSEVYKGRIQDKFTPVIREKIRKMDSDIVFEKIVPDDKKIIREAIFEAKDKGAELIILTGGMSVDPDDKTPGAIKSTGAEIISYGSPVLPGSMMLVAYLEGIPILGLPGCVMYSKTTVFDILLPKVLAGEEISIEDISKLGYGGLCLNCEPCVYPNCCFGKA